MPQSQWTAGPAPTEAWTAGPIPSSQLETPKPKELNTRERVVSGAWNALKGMATTAAKASGIPGMFREGTPGAIKDQAEVIKSLFYDPPAEMLERARNAETPGEQQAYGAAALLPVVGPIAGHIGTEIAEGRTPEVVGEMAVGAALPFVPKAMRAAKGSVAAGARSAAGAMPSGARAAVLGHAAKYAAKQIIPPMAVDLGAGAINILKKMGKAAEPVAEPAAMPRALADDPPPPSYAAPESVAPEVVAPPVEAPVVEPPPVVKPSRPVLVKKPAAEQLRDKMSAKELTRVRKELGTQDVKIARYEPRQDASGKFTGVSDPVYVMPDEFLEHAQTMGLRARGHTALEKSSRGKQ